MSLCWWYIPAVHIAYLHYIYGQDTSLNHVHQFACAARRLGHRVDIHAMNLAPPPVPADGDASLLSSSSFSSSLAHKLRQAAKDRFSRYLHDPKELYWNLRYLRKEYKLLSAEPPDVVLVRNHSLEVSCILAARYLGVPLVLEVNAPAEEGRRYYDEYVHWSWFQDRANTWKLRHADAVTVVSDALKRHLTKKQKELDPGKIVVVPNGADVELFRPEAVPDPEFPIGEAPRIGFIGSFQKFHGLDLLVEMVKRVTAARPEARFLLVGGGPGAQEVRGEVGHLPGVDFTDWVSHERVPGLVASLDVGIMPESNFYGSPLKVIEWMAAGKAVVAPSYGPLREIIDDGREGVLFPPGDLEALVAAIVGLIDDSERRQRMGEAAHERVMSSLTWRHNAERVLDACEIAKASNPG